jgi:peroxiredoxin
MEAYRDQYATIFNNGKNVAVIGISTDDDTVQANWAHEKNFPVYFASDPDRVVAAKYGVGKAAPLVNMDNRDLFVIGPDGKVTYVVRGFKVLVADAYTELGDAVRKAAGGKP